MEDQSVKTKPISSQIHNYVKKNSICETNQLTQDRIKPMGKLNENDLLFRDFNLLQGVLRYFSPAEEQHDLEDPWRQTARTIIHISGCFAGSILNYWRVYTVVISEWIMNKLKGLNYPMVIIQAAKSVKLGKFKQPKGLLCKHKQIVGWSLFQKDLKFHFEVWLPDWIQGFEALCFQYLMHI